MKWACASGLCTLSSLDRYEDLEVMSMFTDTDWQSSGSSYSGTSIAAFSDDYGELIAKHSWVTQFYKQTSNLNNVKALVPYYKEINGLIHLKEFIACDVFLRHIRAHQLSDVLLVGLVRLTFTVKDNLSSWDDLLVKVTAELQQRGHDTKTMLKGII